MSDRVCANCKNCARVPGRERIETRCCEDGHFIDRMDYVSDWCRKWGKKKEENAEQGVDNGRL